GRGYAEAAYQKAEVAYREALRRDPGDHLSRAYLGVILRSGGRMAEARDVLDPGRPGESESALALPARGPLPLAAGAFESAPPSDAAAPPWTARQDSSWPTRTWAAPCSTVGDSPTRGKPCSRRAAWRGAGPPRSSERSSDARPSSGRRACPAGSSPRSPTRII